MHPRRIAPLTGLRALAAALVCLTHAAFSTGHYTADIAGHLWARLEIGVPIFFALSGLLLFRPWIEMLISGDSQQPSVRRYAWHRFLRVVPAYWVVVTAVYLLGTVRPEPNPSGAGIDGYLRNLGFLQIYGLGHLRVGLTQAWSLCVEVAFYLALPLIGWFLTAVVCRYQWRPRRVFAALAALAAISPLWIAIAPHLMPTAALWPPAYLWWFVAGMALATLMRTVGQWPARGTAACLIAAAAAFALAVQPAIAGAPTLVPAATAQAMTKSGLYVIIAVGLIAPLVLAAHQRSLYHRFLGSRPMVWLGEISYEFFLVHLIVMDVLLLDVFGWNPFHGNVAIAMVATTAVSLPLAWALHAALPVGDNGSSDRRRDAADDRPARAHRRTGTSLV